MKLKNLFSLLIIAIISIQFFSCDKIKDAAKINIALSSEDVEFTIPIISATGATTLAAQDVYLNVDSIIKTSNTKLSAKNIRSVTIKSFDITMIDGDATNNFSALESFKIDFKSNVNTNLNTLAEITNNPDIDAQTLSVPVNSSINLKDYFNATTFTYELSGNARKTTSHPIQCKATITYNLEAGL